MLTAKPGDGSKFGGWSEACGAARSCEVTTDRRQDDPRDVLAQARARTTKATLDVGTRAGPRRRRRGARTAARRLTYAHGRHDRDAARRARPAASTVTWTGADCGHADTCQVTVDARPRTLTAAFAVHKTYRSTSRSPANGRRVRPGLRRAEADVTEVKSDGNADGTGALKACDGLRASARRRTARSRSLGPRTIGRTSPTPPTIHARIAAHGTGTCLRRRRECDPPCDFTGAQTGEARGALRPGVDRHRLEGPGCSGRECAFTLDRGHAVGARRSPSASSPWTWTRLVTAA